MTRWTKQQQEAINNRGQNLLVSAAAGSGKTAVLVERIIKLIIEDKIHIDEMLIVTFTNAAAGEMRERIAKAILGALEKEGDKDPHIRKQLTLLNKATIATLHSFCIQVVKKHFHAVDIDPSFRIADTTETLILQQEIMEDLIEEEYMKGEETFFNLVEAFGGSKDDAELQQLIMKLHQFIQSQPYPIKWLEEKTQDFMMDVEDFEESLWGKTIKTGIEIQLKGILDLLYEAKEICMNPAGPHVYLEAIEDDIVQVEELMEAVTLRLEDFSIRLQAIEYKTLSRASKDFDEALKEEVKSLRNKSKDTIKKLLSTYFEAPLQDRIADLKDLYPVMEYLTQLVDIFHNRFRQKKNQKGILDFNDLEHYTLEILEDDLVASEYRQAFSYIFIDEYQDSNIVQETIIRRIKRENNLFMVGDVKQSIYRFRLADPTLFIEKYDSFPADDSGINKRIDLSRNFRSRPEILAGVNFIFKSIMCKTIGEIDYTHDVALHPGREFPTIEEPSLQLHIIEKNLPEEFALEDELEELEDIEVEARIVAKTIKEALQKNIYDDQLGEFRRTQYRDIVVLLRATSNWASVFTEVFMEEGLPSYADINTGYFDAIEVKLFLSLLRILDNKRQDVPLISVMRSPIGGFSVDELITVRARYKEGSYFKAVEKYIKEEEDSLSTKLSTFLQRIGDWSKEARYMKMDEFIWKLFVDSGYYHYVGAMPGGQQRQGNLRVFLDRASQFQNTSIKGLFNFISFIEKLQNSRGDMGSAKILSENDDVIRLMSVHKSKGLEFPVVIVAGLGKQFNLRDASNRLLLHKDLGLGPDYVDHQLRVVRDTIAKLAMKERIKLESLSEEMRILYVALTRPKDKLILVGSVKDIEKKCEGWSRGLGLYGRATAKTALDWIASPLFIHPDGHLLRRLSNKEDSGRVLPHEESNWLIEFHNRGDVIIDKKHKDIEKNQLLDYLNDFNRGLSSNFKEDIYRRLDWIYPNKDAIKIPSKLSVTDIKKLHQNKDGALGYKIPPLIKIPKFIEEKDSLTAAERGTVLHFVLQHLDLKATLTMENILWQIDGMVKRELLTEVEAKSVLVERLVKFFDSPIGKRLLNAEEIYREVPFNLRMKAADFISDISIQEDLLVQGVIDCYFIEDDKAVLLDYKSDRILEGMEDVIVANYKEQLLLYKEAIEKISRTHVKESYLYLFDIDKAVKVD
ncbi:helicase-exonuclease AddAB subunit AddA [Alkaliphilus serpentinus]|uniref:ATP-dependent helicase/nuclease subunit A n=1 Tax=Alkaliphilus serpentinus TaxID=1482731 RepID=A0A833M9G3_9FIRM|nr:helicase-exonuclease AddAB subunit AddA [Alkaliphilus serpentinus]KAB3533440.1 helicase-exonuclease AddAB subunit AddA [Alkaliphilus serpentinus]